MFRYVVCLDLVNGVVNVYCDVLVGLKSVPPGPPW